MLITCAHMCEANLFIFSTVSRSFWNLKLRTQIFDSIFHCAWTRGTSSASRNFFLLWGGNDQCLLPTPEVSVDRMGAGSGAARMDHFEVLRGERGDFIGGIDGASDPRTEKSVQCRSSLIGVWNANWINRRVLSPSFYRISWGSFSYIDVYLSYSTTSCALMSFYSITRKTIVFTIRLGPPIRAESSRVIFIKARQDIRL